LDFGAATLSNSGNALASMIFVYMIIQVNTGLFHGAAKFGKRQQHWAF
jgi:hypothetical protein